MRVKKRLSTVLLTTMLASAISPAVYAAGPVNDETKPTAEVTVPRDLPGHWASGVMSKWMGAGLLQGYEDQTIHPDGPITRAEFAALINRIFGFSEKGSAVFTDVLQGDWFAKDVAIGQKAGYIEGYEDGTFHPNAPIERQDAALIFYKAFALSGGTAPLSFRDAGEVESYAREAVSALKAAGYTDGYDDGTFRPAATLTRAEAIALVDKIVGVWVPESGIFKTQEVPSNLVVNTKDVTLDHTVIQGNLYLAAGIGEGDVTLDHVTVKGKTYISGGGTNSIHLLDSVLGQVEVNKPNDQVRLVAKGASSVAKVEMKSGGKLEEDHVTGEGFNQVNVEGEPKQGTEVQLEGDFGQVVIGKTGSLLNLLQGKIANLLVNSPSHVKVAEKAQVGTVELKESSNGTKLESKGSIDSVVNNGDQTTVNDQPIEKGKEVSVEAGGAVKGPKPKPTPTPTATSAPGGGSSSSHRPASPTPTPTPTNSATPTPTPTGTVTPTPTPTNSATPTPTPTNSATPTPTPTGTVTPTPTPTNSATPTPTPTNSATPTPTPTTNPSDWTLVWNDEFNGQELDRSKWTFDIGNGDGGWGNNELEYYTDRSDNVKVENGNLLITGKKEEYQGFHYTSSKLKTKDLFKKKYGKFEIRAKFPKGKGYWPAIWMLPNDSVYGNWASSGEIDIMEGWGSKPDTVAGTIHYGQTWPNNTYTGKSYKLPDNSTIEDFHTYGLEWEPGELRWYVDGVLYSTQNDWYSKSLNQPANNAYPAPFDEDFYMILNLAIGGNFDGNPDDSTLFPGVMAVDYVRVYELTGREYREPTPPSIPKEPMPTGARLPLEDGNLVYNSGFDSANSPTEYWRLYEGDGGDGTLGVENLNGTNFAKITIASAGWQPYSVQLLNDVSIAKGHFYKLSFDAKASAAREINVKVTGGETRGYAAYSQASTFALNTGLQHYEILFQMKQDSDIAARIEVNAGLNANTVWVGNMRMVEIDSIPFDHDGIKAPLSDGNHLYNGTFDQGEPNRMSFWHYTAADGTVSTHGVPENTRNFVLNATDAGTGKDAITLSQKGINLITGQSYRLTFDADSDAVREIAVQWLGSDGTTVYANQTVALPAGSSHQTVDFSVAQPTTDNGTFRFLLGGQDGRLALDNVKMIRTSVYFEPDVVFYPLGNGQFNEGMDLWETATDSGGSITGEVVNGEAKLNIAADGQNPWSNMFIQSSLSLFKGVTYRLEFDARASVGRKLEVIAENASYTRYIDQTVDLTGDTKHYAFEFTMPKNDTASLKFLLGKVASTAVGSAHNVIIDNVVLQVKDAPVAQQPRLVKDKTNNVKGQPIEITFADHADWRAAVTAVQLNGQTLAADRYTLEAGKLTLPADLFPNASNYTITVRATGYAFASVVQDVLAGDGNLVSNGSFANGLQDWSSWSGDGGAFTAQAAGGTAELNITAIGPNNWSNQFFHPGIAVEGGKSYTLSFKASSSVARAIVVEYSGLTLSGPAQVTFNLTPETKLYQATFTPSANGTLKLNYLIGKIDGTTPAAAVLKLSEVKIAEGIVGGGDTGGGDTGGGTPGPEPVLTLAEQFPLKNGDFTNGLTGWTDFVQGRYDGWDNVTHMAVEGGKLNYYISSEGNETWNVMLMQNNLQLKKDATYVITVDASSTKDRDAEIVLDDASNTRYLSQKIHLTGSAQTFSFELKPTADMTVSFKLLLGKYDTPVGTAHVVTVNRVQVEAKGARAADFPLVNGEFNDGTNGWSNYVHTDGAAASFDASTGGLKAAIGNAGTETWSIQLFQNGFAFKKGQEVTVSFDARSTKARDIEVIAENAGYNRYLNQPVSLTEATGTYSYTFTMTADDTVNFKFLLGNVGGSSALGAHDLFLDNVRFEIKGAKDATGEKYTAATNIRLPDAPVLTPDLTDNAIGQPVELTFTDNEAWRTGIREVYVDGQLADASAYTAAAGSITLAAGLFQSAKTYSIEIRSTGFEPTAAQQTVEADNKWSLVWSDEFNGGAVTPDTNGVDLSKWAYQNGTGADYGLDGWGNNEQEYYQKQNIQVTNGNLVITAKKETVGNKPYTSGRLWTSPTFAKAYGKFEARIKMPEGQGIWPAFWLMPKDSKYGGWASSGEIDIMEARGRVPDEVAGTIHYGKPWPDNKSTGSSFTFPQGQDITGFHTYGLEWEPGELRWYVDGQLYQTVNNWYSWGAGQPAQYPYPAPFDQDFYIILNLAVGGNFDGGVEPAASDLPGQMVVDYVRVYDLKGGYPTPTEPELVKDQLPEGAKAALADPNFEHIAVKTAGDTLDHDYWNAVTGTGGAATATAEAIDGTSYAKTVIASGGSNDYSVQLIQQMALAKGHFYKVSFDAKSTADRNLNVKMSGGADRGWGAYSDVYSAPLKSTVQSYSYTFQMVADTDLNARLEFEMGLDTHTVWISNVKVVEVGSLTDPNGPKEPLDNGNHVYNGGFELGRMDRMIFWNFEAPDAAAAAVVDPQTETLQVSISDAGTVPGDIRLVQKGINLLQTDEYTLTFTAQAAANRTIGVELVSKDGGTVYAAQTFNLTNAMAGQSFTFTMPAGVSDAEGQLRFLFGGSGESVSLDNVKLVRNTNRNVDYSGVNMFPLQNGDFVLGSDGLQKWEPFVQGGAATFSTVSGEAKISITNVGTEAWNVMLNQGGLTLTKGFQYELSFDARSSVNRDIQVTLENASYNRRFDSGSIGLTGSSKHFTYTIKTAADEALALKFILGKTPGSPASAHDVFISNVKLELKNAPVERPATLIPDTTNNKVGQPVEIGFTSNPAWAAAITGVKVNQTLLSESQYQVGANSITLTADVFQADGAYTVTVSAAGYADASTVQSMIRSDGNLVYNGDFSGGSASWGLWNNAADWSEWSVTNGAAKVQIHYDGETGNEWNVPFSWSTQLFQEGIQLQAGKTYQLSFKAWSTKNRPIAVEYNGYAGNPKVSFNITGDSNTVYTGTLTPSAATSLKLIFLLGNADGSASTEHTVTIDDVIIKEVLATPVLTADNTDNKVGQAMVLTFPDNAAWRAAVTSVSVDGTALLPDQYSLAAGSLTILSSVFPSVKDYTVAVAADGYTTATVVQAVKTAAANVALGKTATSSSNNQPAGLAVDGNPGTRWETASSDPQWIAVDLGGTYKLDTVTLNWEGAFGKAYKIQVSTVASPGESDWSDVFTTVNGDGTIDNIDMSGVEARHVRVYGTARGTPYGYSLWELEVYGTLQSGGGSSGGGGSSSETTAPYLASDTTNAVLGQPITLTFADDAAWRSAITAIQVNGATVTQAVYTVNPGSITLAASAFSSAGTYLITVEATGYQTASVNQAVQEPALATTAFYLLGSGALSLTAGSSESAAAIPQDQSPVTFTVQNLNGTYNGSGSASSDLYLNGLAVGLGIEGKVSYDFDGDGNWDRVDSISMMPTDGALASGSYETFNRTLSKQSGGDYADFSNGSVKVEIHVLFGGGDAELKVDAPSHTSVLILPYSLS